MTHKDFVNQNQGMTHLHSLLNNPSTPMEDRLGLAWAFLTSPNEVEECYVSHSIAACKCWLTYRACDGLVSYEDWENKVRNIHVQYDITDKSGLPYRWAMSQAIANAYLHCLNHKWPMMVSELNKILDMENDINLWPPAVCNYVRAGSMMSYFLYLRHDKTLAKTVIHRSVALWQKTSSTFNFVRWPLRFEEMKGDLLAIMNMMFIGKACGMMEFPHYDWCHEGKFNKQFTNEPHFYTCMRELGTMDPARQIWPSS